MKNPTEPGAKYTPVALLSENSLSSSCSALERLYILVLEQVVPRRALLHNHMGDTVAGHCL